MELQFHSILTSPVFTFKIGEHGTEMRLPTALVLPCSPVLEKLVGGEMMEAKTGIAELKDVDEGTFVRFGKWLYTGAYDAPAIEAGRLRSESFNADKLVPWDFGLTTVGKRKKEKEMKLMKTWDQRVREYDLWDDTTSPGAAASGLTKKESTWNAFLHDAQYRPAAPPRENVATKYTDLTEEFLAHAKLYCFADRYGIGSLMELCLEILRMSLTDCECQPSQVAGVVELIAFTVDNTPPLGGNEREGGLRALVLSYAVIVFEVLCEDKIFQQMLEEGGSFVTEILSLLMKRLA